MWRGEAIMDRLLRIGGSDALKQEEKEAIMSDYERMCWVFANLHNMLPLKVTQAAVIIRPDEGVIKDSEFVRESLWSREQCRQMEVPVTVQDDVTNDSDVEGV